MKHPVPRSAPLLGVLCLSAGASALPACSLEALVPVVVDAIVGRNVDRLEDGGARESQIAGTATYTVTDGDGGVVCDEVVDLETYREAEEHDGSAMATYRGDADTGELLLTIARGSESNPPPDGVHPFLSISATLNRSEHPFPTGEVEWDVELASIEEGSALILCNVWEGGEVVDTVGANGESAGTEHQLTALDLTFSDASALSTPAPCSDDLADVGCTSFIGDVHVAGTAAATSDTVGHAATVELDVRVLLNMLAP